MNLWDAFLSLFGKGKKSNPPSSSATHAGNEANKEGFEYEVKIADKEVVLREKDGEFVINSFSSFGSSLSGDDEFYRQVGVYIGNVMFDRLEAAGYNYSGGCVNGIHIENIRPGKAGVPDKTPREVLLEVLDWFEENAKTKEQMQGYLKLKKLGFESAIEQSSTKLIEEKIAPYFEAVMRLLAKHDAIPVDADKRSDLEARLREEFIAVYNQRIRESRESPNLKSGCEEAAWKVIAESGILGDDFEKMKRIIAELPNAMMKAFVDREKH